MSLHNWRECCHHHYWNVAIWHWRDWVWHCCCILTRQNLWEVGLSIHLKLSSLFRLLSSCASNNAVRYFLTLYRHSFFSVGVISTVTLYDSFYSVFFFLTIYYLVYITFGQNKTNPPGSYLFFMNISKYSVLPLFSWFFFIFTQKVQ